MAIEDYVFPMQSLTSKAAMNPNANIMGLASSPFAVQSGQSGGAGLMGLAGIVDQYAGIRDQRQMEQPPANQFASQTPGAPSQPGRVDSGMDPLTLLDQNINRRFGL